MLFRPLLAAASLTALAACGTDEAAAPAGVDSTLPVAEADGQGDPDPTATPSDQSPVEEASTTDSPASLAPTAADVASNSGPVSTEVEPSVDATVRSNCRRVDDFEAGNRGWFIVNDGVMGGRSAGAATSADSVLQFSGTVVTAGGGFTSVRLRIDGDLVGSDRLELRVRSDDRIYGVTYEDDADRSGRPVSHRTDLVADAPADDDGFQVITVDHADTTASIFGQPVDAAPFDADTAAEIGIILADSRDGDINLAIEWIDA